MGQAATDIDIRMMGLALELAGKAGSLGEVPVGAVVYDASVGDGQVIATGWNQRETLADPTAHAELLAMRKAALRRGRWRLDGLSLAVTLEPCPMCAGAIINSRIGRVVFAASDPKAGCVGSLYDLLTDARFNHRPTVVEPIMADESAAMLQAFFKARR